MKMAKGSGVTWMGGVPAPERVTKMRYNRESVASRSQACHTWVSQEWKGGSLGDLA